MNPTQKRGQHIHLHTQNVPFAKLSHVQARCISKHLDHPTIVCMGENAKSWPGIDSGVSQTDLAKEIAMLTVFVCIVVTLLRRLSEDEGRPDPTPCGAKALPSSLRPSPGDQSRQKQSRVLPTSPRPSPANQSRHSKQEAGTSLLASSARSIALSDSSWLNNARRDPIIAPSRQSVLCTSFIEGFGDVCKPSKDMNAYNSKAVVAGMPPDAAASKIASMIRSAPNLYTRDSRVPRKPKNKSTPDARVSSGSRYFAELIRQQGGNNPYTPTWPSKPLTPLVAPSTPYAPRPPMPPSAQLRAGHWIVERTDANGPMLRPLLRAKFTKKREEGRDWEIVTQTHKGRKGEGKRNWERSAELFERVTSWDCSKGEQE